MKYSRIVKTAAAAAMIFGLAGCKSGTSGLKVNEEGTEMTLTAENVAGGGHVSDLTVKEGCDRIIVEYKVEKGSFDISISEGGLGGKDADIVEEVDEAQNGEALFSQKGISGEGTLEYNVSPGDYTVTFNENDLTGSVVVKGGSGS